MANDFGKQFIALAGAITLGGLLVEAVTRKWGSVSLTLAQLVNPESVSTLADELDTGTPDDFILNAWDYVGSNIKYAYYGSILHFYDSSVSCQKCLLPKQVINREVANCVGKSVLLTSILRNRIANDSVYTVIGEYHIDSIGGHAWVQVFRNGIWYLVEATGPPPAEHPWVPVSALSSIYIPDAWINDMGLICYDQEMCSFEVNDKPCCACTSEDLTGPLISSKLHEAFVGGGQCQ